MRQKNCKTIQSLATFFAVSFLCVLIACKNNSANEIRIGIITSLNGAAVDQGKNWMRGAVLAEEDANKQGIPVKLIVEDDQTQPAKVVSAFTKLVEVDGVKAIVGGTWDYLGEAAYPLAKRFKIPFITPSNPVEVLSDDAKASGYVYSNSMTLASVKKAMQKFFEKEHANTIGLVYPNLPFGTQQAALVKEIAQTLNLTITYEYEFPMEALMSDNMKLASLKLNEARPDATFAVLDYNGIDLLTNEFKKLKFFPKILTTQHLDQAFMFSKDPERYRAMYAIYPKIETSDFPKRFEAKYGEPPHVYAEHGYDAVMFLAKALMSGIDIANPAQQFTYKGITGVHTLPAPSRGLVDTQAKIMTTKDGSFEEIYSGE